MAGQRPATGERGTPLSLMLLLILALQLWVVLVGLYNWRSLEESHGGGNSIVPLAGAALGLVGVVALLGMWFLRRWAVQLFIGLFVVGVLADIWFGLTALGLLIRFVLLGLLGWFVMQRWASFR